MEEILDLSLQLQLFVCWTIPYPIFLNILHPLILGHLRENIDSIHLYATWSNITKFSNGWEIGLKVRRFLVMNLFWLPTQKLRHKRKPGIYKLEENKFDVHCYEKLSQLVIIVSPTQMVLMQEDEIPEYLIIKITNTKGWKLLSI